MADTFFGFDADLPVRTVLLNLYYVGRNFIFQII